MKDLDNEISPPDLKMSNQKCQTSRNQFKNQFSLHLFETSQDVGSEQDNGCKFESMESIYISEEGGPSSSHLSFIAKFQHLQE
jgi:hypothetical protein